MKDELNYELLEFHVREATTELNSLLSRIWFMQDRQDEEGQLLTDAFEPLTEEGFAVSLEHAYHHLNFAWNGRFKTMHEADAQFARNEKFPRPNKTSGWFAKFWPKSMFKENMRSS